MARFRNVSDDVRLIPEASPQTVLPDGLFDVPDDRADEFDKQPWFAPATPAKSTKKGDI
jgi:hypothetical protein